jgi:prefoldin alpha subunit
MDPKEELQGRVVEMEPLRAQGTAIQQQLMVVLNTLQALTIAEQALENLDKLEKKSEILVPLGGGAFANASLGDTSKVILNLGANVMAEKKRTEALKVLNDQIKQLQDAQLKLENAIATIDMRLNQLTYEMQALLQAQK